MPRPQNGTSNSVSLFPFLAVLVCAMGALIFLLIVTTRRVRSDAIARAEHVHSIPPVEEPLPDPAPVEEIDPPKPKFVAKPVPKKESFVKAKPRPIDPDIDLKLELASLNRERNQRRIQFAEKKTDWSVARERLQSTESKLNSAKRRKQQAAEELQQYHERQQSTVAEQQQLSRQIKTTEERLNQLRRTNDEKEDRYALIPYDGRSGTTRKPIFIECSGAGIKFLPEGVTLRPDDLNGFTLESNPLLAGARSLIEYWSDKADRNNDPEDQAQPYVLLLVRPSGSVAYYAARKLLSRLEHQYGYELIEEDWKLDFPDADPESRRICQNAVEEAMSEQRERGGSLIVATRAGRGGKRIRFDRGSGTFEVIEPDATSTSSTGSTSESGKGAWQQSPGEGGGGSFTDTRQKSSPKVSSSFAEGRGSNGVAGNEPSFEGDQKIAGYSPFRNGERNGISSGLRGDQTQNGAIRGFDLPEGNIGDRNTDDSFLGSKQQGRFPGNQIESAESGGPRLPADSLTQGTDISRSTEMDHRFPRPLSATGTRSDQRRSSRSERPFAWAETGKSDNTSASEEWSSTRHKSSGTGTGSGKKRDFESPGNFAASGMSKTAENGDAQPRNPLDDLDRAYPRLPSRLSSKSATGKSSSSSPTGSSGASSPYSTGEQAGSQAQSSMQFGSKSALPQQRRKTSRLEESSSERFRRRRWGYSDYSASIGFEREVVISVDAQSLVVGRDYRIPLGPRDRVGDRLARRVLDGIEHQSRLWGKPPSSFYWVPRVRFRIGEGGSEYVERLREPLREAGLVSRVERNNESNRVTQQPE